MATNPKYHDIGRSFVQQYYALLNGDAHARKSLANFYTADTSLMTFEGQQFVGQRKITERFETLDLRSQHTLTEIDTQPTQEGGVLVVVLGQVKTDDDPPQTFNQTFVLKPSGESFYVQHDIFRIALQS
ncbi:ketosteroid isomerase family protein [Streptomyces sp. RKAG293]|uniref:ketosteroid isomerase family protein n=1 Tax=Streptomyces sp. RKAG293 TaxID=2893403 RepID=UPI0020335B31|nr:ketosteroid isomerase family protein [Streptomyces sp. RKAG293]MCM2422715.1 ketosteroid isomerase family protein [Streptomyces sp. RKAG293]